MNKHANRKYYYYCSFFFSFLNPYINREQQQQKSPPNIRNNGNKIPGPGPNTPVTTWSKYKRGSAVGTVSTVNNTSAGSVTSTVIVIEEFDADVFRQLVEYVHTGCVTLQPRTLLGTYPYGVRTSKTDNIYDMFDGRFTHFTHF